MSSNTVRKPLTRLSPRVATARLQHVATQSTSHGTGARLRGRGLQERNARYLAKHPLCVQCEERHTITPAAEVDHIVPLHLGGEDGGPNLQGLCHACHEAKTILEARARLSTNVAPAPSLAGNTRGDRTVSELRSAETDALRI